MSEELWSPIETARAFLRPEFRLLDVRAPVEFAHGHIPGSQNHPLLNDDERARVGTTYKQQGREAAIRLGHELISGDVRVERVRAWRQALEGTSGAVTCWRGGLRSQISQNWIQESGVAVARVKGGYKAFRNWLTEQGSARAQERSWTVISGATGAGKTELLKALPGRAQIDLEAAAHHRGSAFGGYDQAQPSQSTFENDVGLQFFRRESLGGPWLIEDESRMVGSIVVPEAIFLAMRSSPVVRLEEPLARRVDRTIRDYVENPLRTETGAAERLRGGIHSISKKLGGLKTSEILRDFETADEIWRLRRDASAHRTWVEKLLRDYYDPFYQRSFEKRAPRVLFRGESEACAEFLKERRDAGRP